MKLALALKICRDNPHISQQWLVDGALLDVAEVIASQYDDSQQAEAQLVNDIVAAGYAPAGWVPAASNRLARSSDEVA